MYLRSFPLASFRYALNLGKRFDRLCMHLTESHQLYVLITGEQRGFASLLKKGPSARKGWRHVTSGIRDRI